MMSSTYPQLENNQKCENGKAKQQRLSRRRCFSYISSLVGTTFKPFAKRLCCARCGNTKPGPGMVSPLVRAQKRLLFVSSPLPLSSPSTLQRGWPPSRRLSEECRPRDASPVTIALFASAASGFCTVIGPNPPP